MTGFVMTVRNDIRELTSLSPQVKFILLIQIVVLFSLSILIGIFFSPKFKDHVVVQNLPQKKSPSNILNLRTTRLTISPEDHLMKIGETSTFAVMVEGEDPQAVDIVIHFDPAFISISDVKNSGLLDFERINEIKNGAIYFSAGASVDQLNKPKRGTLFTFSAKALRKTEETELIFDEKLTITAVNGKNTVKNTAKNTVWGGIIRILD